MCKEEKMIQRQKIVQINSMLTRRQGCHRTRRMQVAKKDLETKEERTEKRRWKQENNGEVLRTVYGRKHPTCGKKYLVKIRFFQPIFLHKSIEKERVIVWFSLWRKNKKCLFKNIGWYGENLKCFANQFGNYVLIYNLFPKLNFEG